MTSQDRCFLLLALVPILPDSRLHHIPTLLPEVVLGTKEHNREAREASYDLLARMGRRMAAGGVVDRSLVSGEETMSSEGVPSDTPRSTALTMHCSSCNHY